MNEDVPVLNTMMEDFLARAITEEGRAVLIEAWLMFGATYLAREVGRGLTRDTLRSLDRYVRDAEDPTRPWKP